MPVQKPISKEYLLTQFKNFDNDVLADKYAAAEIADQVTELGEVVSQKGNVSSIDAQTIVVLDRAEYNALPVKDPKTLYLIKG